MVKKIIQDFQIIENTVLTDNHFIIKVKSPTDLPSMLPGQFAEILIPDVATVFLRRPISIHDFDAENKTIGFFVKCVGNGTNKLRSMKPGEMLNIITPLGNTFDLTPNRKVLLVGGGCGVAPLFYLAKYLQSLGCEVSILIGAKSAKDISLLDNFRKIGSTCTTTEDGTIGEKGFVTAHKILNEQCSEFDKIYCCGPEPMMKAVAGICKKNNVDCEVSLENTMACGIGACLCCVTDTVDGHQCVCTEGPVFNIKKLKW